MAQIIWSQQAKDDLEAIHDYISRDSSVYALSMVRKIIHATEKLMSFPRLGMILPKYEKQKYRQILFQNYRIIYKREMQKIVILTVVHTSRNINGHKIETWDDG